MKKTIATLLYWTINISAYFTLIFICFYALFFAWISFDGAMHMQAGLNMFTKGKFILDYTPELQSEIKSPIEFFNGLFVLILGKNTIAVNLFNTICYFSFFLIIKKLSKQLNTVLPLIFFSFISFSPGFLEFAFGGYGEFPALMFALIGMYILLKKSNYINTLLSAILVAFSLSSKWVMVLIIPGVLTILLLNRDKKKTIIFLSTCAAICLGIFIYENIYSLNMEYESIKPFFLDILYQATPTENTFYNNYVERIGLFWNQYVTYSNGYLIAILKIILFAINAIVGTTIISKHLINKEVSHKSITKFYLFLLISSTIYILWWFFLSAKPWYRRALNADILLILTTSLSLWMLQNIYKEKSPILKTTIIICSAIIFINAVHVGAIKFTDTIQKKEDNAIFKSEMLINSLKSLNEDSIFFGYGWWQAPKWAFFSNKKFKDLYKEDHSICYKTNSNCYIFFEVENQITPDELDTINNRFNLETITEFGSFSIKKILPKNQNFKYKLGAIINWSTQEDIYKFDPGGWSSSESTHTWTIGREATLSISLEKLPEKDLEMKLTLTPFTVPNKLDEQMIEVYINDNYIQTFSAKTYGEYSIEIPLKYIETPLINIKLSISNPTVPASLGIDDDSRELGIALHSITIEEKK